LRNSWECHWRNCLRINWLLDQVTAAKTKPETLLTDAAATLLCEKLTMPLQFEFYLTRAFEEAFRVGQKPVDADTINDILMPDLDGLEARLTRNGYNVKLLTDILTANPILCDIVAWQQHYEFVLSFIQRFNAPSVAHSAV
jgi:hypothetical protein